MTLVLVHVGTRHSSLQPINNIIINRKCPRKILVTIIPRLPGIQPCDRVTIVSLSVFAILILDRDHRANNIQLTDNLVGRTTIIASIRIREVILDKRHVHPNSQFLRQLHIQIRTSVKLFTI